MKYYLGLDVGTSSVKACAIDCDGHIHAFSIREYDLSSPFNGWSEEEPETWWQACVDAIKDVILALPDGAKHIESIAVSNQMHSLVLLDEHRNSLRPSILHNDARTSVEMRQLWNTLGEDAERLTMNPIVNGMTLTSLLWVQNHEPDMYCRIAHIMVPGDYIRMRLCGNISTDHSNASATLMYNFAENGWSADICDAVSIHPDVLPPIYNSCDLAGYITTACAMETGLIVGIPVFFGGADQVMQSIGCGSLLPGQATVNIGSGGQVCVQSKSLHAAPEKGINTFVSFQRERWYLMGANTNGGSAYKWFCRNILSEQDYNAFNAQIRSIQPGSNGLVFLPYLNGERCPHRNADLSGMFVGLTYHTDRASMARAVMEGITYSLYDCLNSCRDVGCEINRMIALGGCTNNPIWLQMQADIYGIPLKVTVSHEQAVIGAAICGAVGCGAFESIARACASVVRYQNTEIKPDLHVHDAYQAYYHAYRDIYLQSKEVLERITLLGKQTTND